MSQQFINCPKCGERIELSEAISHEIEEKLQKHFEAEIKKRERAHQGLLEAKEKELQEKLAKERAKIEERAKKAAEEATQIELIDLKTQLEDKARKLDSARKAEIELRQKQRELEDKEKALEVELVRRVDVERERAREAVSRDLEEKYRLKDAEKDHQLGMMRKQIDDLKRKAEQGSQKTQGEVLEIEVEELLKKQFPFDDIEPISKGVRGADVLQIVKTQSGKPCGKILWETKRSKNWSDSWIEKLKDDQREAKAGLAVLVSESLPPGFHHFRHIDGVWVTDIPSVVSLGLALRVVLIQVANTREAEVGKKEKMELLYSYLMGPEFKNRVSAIVEAFSAMSTDLEAEKRAMQRIWDKRAKQIEKVISNTAGMYGDIEGIAGAALPSIKVLELPSGDDAEAEVDLEVQR